MSFRNGLFSCSLGGVSYREVLIFQKSSFMDCAFCVISEMLSPNSKSSRFPLVLSSRSVLILPFPFRCMTYFELVFVKGERPLSRFIFLHVDVQLSIYLHFKDEQFQYSHMFGLFYQCIP